MATPVECNKIPFRVLLYSVDIKNYRDLKSEFHHNIGPLRKYFSFQIFESLVNTALQVSTDKVGLTAPLPEEK